MHGSRRDANKAAPKVMCGVTAGLHQLRDQRAGVGERELAAQGHRGLAEFVKLGPRH